VTLEPSRVRSLLRFALLGAALLAAFAVRVVTSAASELRAGDAYRANGQLEAAVVHYRRAARWYAPGSPFHVTALSDLQAIGADAERRGDSELALSSYRAIRAAIMSARSFYVPERERLEAADERIAFLMAALPAPPMDAGKSQERLRREHLALLRAPRGPSLFWSFVLLLGFAAWVGGAFAFSRRAIDDDDRFVRGEVMRWGAVIGVGFGLFVLGLSLA
jgi:tetratricopeptide (TPR) repeat protein